MISFFDLKSQKFDEIYELKQKNKEKRIWDEIDLQAAIEACLELIDQDFNPNERDEEGQTILGAIIITGRLDLVKFLVEAGAEVNFCDDKTYAPLYIAAFQDSRVIFNYLEPLTSSELKARILLEATFNQDCQVIQALIDSGLDVDAHKEESIKTSKGRTPLIISVQKGHEKMVKIFLKAGANPNLKDEDSGTTPLISAVECQYIYLIRLLLENGADVHLPDDNGDTALEIAMKLQNEKELPHKNKLRNQKIIDLLIKAGVTED